MNTPEIAIAGAGRLTYSLSRALLKAGHNLTGIISRDAEAAKQRLDLPEVPVFSYSDSALHFNVLILAVPDERLQETAIALCLQYNVEYLIHCSGASSLNLISGITKHAGVLYPLQTFTENRVLDFSEIPVLWEGDTDLSRKLVSGLAKTISGKSEETGSSERAILHTGAVFANNFTNFMVYLASRYAVSAGKDSGIYQALLEETMAKLRILEPEVAQTGPARRGDKLTLEKHLEIIRQFQADDAELYNLMSKTIYKHFFPKS